MPNETALRAVGTQQEFSFRVSPELLTPEEIYNAFDVSMIAALKEDRRIERKPARIRPRELSVYFSVFANTSPDGGLIIVGVDDASGAVEGFAKCGQDHVNELEKTGVVFCPDARYESKRIPAINTKGDEDFVLLFRVAYNRKKVVETVDGSAYTRVGDSKKKLTHAEAHELEIDKGQVDLEQETSRIPYPAEFDRDLIKQFADRIRVAASYQKPHSDEEILSFRRLGLLKDGVFTPNVACALAFARDPLTEFPGCKVRFLRYDGEWEHTGAKFNVVKDSTVEGNIPSIVVRIAEILDSQLRDFSRLGADQKFYTTSEYPREAWYEAVVNACVHRSYGALRNMVIFVKMFDDRLMIESPGGFPPFVTPENIYESHHPRNPQLMNALQFLDFVKCANEGTRRMRDSMLSSNLPQPDFSQRESEHPGHTLVRVTLRNNIKQRRVWVDSDASSMIGEAKAKELTQEEHRAVNFVAEHQSINVSQLHQLIGRRWPYSKKLLMKLVRMGIFKHVHKRGKGRDPNAHFILAPQPDQRRRG